MKIKYDDWEPPKLKPSDIPIPVQHSTSQPIPGVELQERSLLRELLERRLEPSVLKHL